MCCCKSLIYYYPGVFSSTTINTDIFIDTLSSLVMPSGSTVPGNLLANDGDYLDIQITGFLPSDSNRFLRLQVAGADVRDLFNIGGTLVNPPFLLNLRLTRASFKLLRMNCITNFNSTQVFHTIGNDFNVDLTHEFSLDFIISQTAIKSIFIDSIQITKFTFSKN